MSVSFWIGVIAGVLDVVGYASYVRGVARSATIPNTASWCLWLLLSLLNLVSFVAVAGTWERSALPAMGSLACAVAFLLLARRGTLQRLTAHEWWIASIALGSLLVWWLTRSAVAGNVTLLVAVSLSFVPTYLGIMEGRTREHPFPWILWTLAYVFLTLAVRIGHGAVGEYLYPVLGIVLHATPLVLGATSPVLARR